MNNMVSTSETGHVKNVASLESLINFVKSYGETYNPIKPSLTVPELEKLRTNSLAAISETQTAKAQYDKAVNARRNVFDGLKPLATRVVNSFSVSGADNLAINNLKSANKKLQGIKSSASAQTVAATGSDAAKPTVKSTSQQSYDQQTAHFSGMIEVLKQNPAYVPNEKELTVAGLEAKLTELQTSNSDFLTAYTAYNNTLLRRNQIMYDPITGISQTAKEVKQYVRSLFGTNAPQYKQIVSIEFKSRP